MVVGTAEDTEVEVIVMAVVMAVVAEEDLMEGAMVKNLMNFPAGPGNLRQNLLYISQTNGDFSTCIKRIIFRK